LSIPLPVEIVPSATDAYALLQELTADLVARARVLRDSGKGRVVTYSRKVFIPLINLCRDRCGYCTFAREEADPTARIMTPDEVLAVAKSGSAAGCKEALFSLGDQPERRYSTVRRRLKELGHDSTLSYLAAMCRLVLDETPLLPHINPGVMSAAALNDLKQVSVSAGIMLESTSQRLLRPGRAHHRCPDKVPNLRLSTITAAGKQRIAFTTGILIGIGETHEERVHTLLSIREQQQRYGHIQEVIVQNFRAKTDTLMRDWPEPSSDDMGRTIAMARLLLGPDANIQAPPNLAGHNYRQYLRAGINDWGGVSPVTLDHINPERPWPEIVALKQATSEEGFELRERLAIYPEYINKPGYLPPRLLARVKSLVDDEGLVKKELTW
jgi:7,8-didemethyl-8-hydroxy-5-deazariboflavin synthase CofG subunit